MFIELALFPTGHREDVRELTGLSRQFLGPRQIQCRQRRIEMNIEDRLSAGLTIGQAGELLAVTKEELNLEAGDVVVHQLAAIQGHVRRSQDNQARFGRLLAIDEDDHTQRPLERDVPDHGGEEMDMRFFLQRAERRKAGQVLEVDLAVILAPPPAPFGMGPGVEKQAVGVVPQFGDGMQLERYHLIQVLLLGKVAIDAVIADPRGQPMALVVELLCVEIYARLLLALVLLRDGLARWGLRHGQRERATTGHIHHGQGRNLQPSFRSIRTAVEEMPQAERLFAALRNERGILHRNEFRARLQHRRQYALRKLRPLEGRAELARNRPLRVVAVATQITSGDAPKQGQNGAYQHTQARTSLISRVRWKHSGSTLCESLSILPCPRTIPLTIHVRPTGRCRRFTRIWLILSLLLPRRRRPPKRFGWGRRSVSCSNMT